jgi:SAM-dependent methyltransferase
MSDLTWEQAVQWLCQQPDQQALVKACYYDDPLLASAQRFANSEEWQATRLLFPQTSGQALDLGAGRGISSYALARDGWQVTALEPDPSSVVGAGAIRALAQETGLSIRVIEEYGESLPFDDNSFDLVYGRQVLHHARDLPLLCREINRVLKPGGQFIATREHVISKPEDLPIFLKNHPLHHLYGGEHAYLLKEYISAISQSGLSIGKMFGPFENVINYFPMSHEEWQTICRKPLSMLLGHKITMSLTNEDSTPGKWLLGRLASVRSKLNHSPGRLYSFVAEKP